MASKFHAVNEAAAAASVHTRSRQYISVTITVYFERIVDIAAAIEMTMVLTNMHPGLLVLGQLVVVVGSRGG
jgi:pectin methylesterase-like acyl-CoA thioesterase